ncbi:MAG: hypothetical protein V2G42_00990 [bacterium JZ-2024 1]
MQSEGGRTRLTLLELIALIVILSILIYSAIRVKASDLRDIEKFIGSETRALERANSGSP